mgnify:FL=1
MTGWIEGRAIDTTVSAEASWSPASGKLNDGVLVDDTWPSDDDADVNGRVWGSWGQASAGMYAQYTWSKEATVDSSRVQFWANFAERNDAKGGLDVPDSWKIQYLASDGIWKDVENAQYSTVRNSPASRASDDAQGWSVATFTPVKTTSLRLVLDPPTAEGVTFGLAVAEWGVHAAESTPDPEPTPDPDPTPDPEPSVDKSRLESAINAAGSVQQANFTPNSWKAFSEAMGNAQKVYADESATQDQVRSGRLKQLEEAQQTLVKKADTTELKTVLDQAQGVSGDLYTEASAKKLAEAVDAASKVLNDENATQADADAAVKQLTEAIAGLELKPAPKPDDDKTDPKPNAKPGNKPVSKSEVSAAISSTGSNVIGIAVVGMIVLLTGAAIMLTRRNRD